MRSTLTMLFAALLLSGCATMTGFGGPEVCAVWRGVSWSAEDSPATIQDVKGNNARRAAWCKI